MKESNGQICAICSIKMGEKQAGVRQLSSGEFAEEKCIKEMMHKELIAPLKNKGFIELGFNFNNGHSPERMMEEMTMMLLLFAYPDFRRVAGWLERIQDFSHTFLCREVDFAKLLARRFF